MNQYLNTDLFPYESICSSKNYVDKTALIHFVNSHINHEGRLILVSRPRRFGKTYAAHMLKAYYTYGHDMKELFKDKKIGQLDPELSYLGAFDVIYLDMLDFCSVAMGEQEAMNERNEGQLDWIRFLEKSLIQELADTYGEDVVENTLSKTLINTVRKTRRKIVWICDEWDVIFREPVDDLCAEKKYIELLRSMFKNKAVTDTVFAAAYMTGIMPMIKMKGESALTEFDNYTMFAPGELAPFIGFTEQEVRDLLAKNKDCDLTYEELAKWYEGYAFPRVGPLFNPRSVSRAIELNYCDAYWVDTTSNLQFRQLVAIQRDTLRRDVERLLQGEELPVQMGSFDNDLKTLPGLDVQGDSATLVAMVHLGYLSYDQRTRCASIPNNEIRSQFLNMLEDSFLFSYI